MTRILIVDDKAENLYLLRALLVGNQMQVDEARHGAEALERARSAPPDLIISDIRMPEMRGDEFLAYLKLNELFKQIPVVMLSSEDSTSERIRLLEEGAEDYIVKPFNPQELKIRIKKILD